MQQEVEEIYFTAYTKQEKIQEGIAQLILDWTNCAKEDATDNYGLATKIITYLKSKGMVIKADRELPKNPTPIPNLLESVGIVEQLDAVSFQAYRDSQRDMLDDKFLAVEDLI